MITVISVEPNGNILMFLTKIKFFYQFRARKNDPTVDENSTKPSYKYTADINITGA